VTSLTERLFGRSFGRQPEIRDGVRGEALMLESVASLKPSLTNMDRRIVGGWRAWACAIPMLVELPGREPYAASPIRWMSREKFPVGGTTLPVTVEREGPASVRIEWDEVPTIDEWIAGGHEVFTDPESVQARYDEGWRAYRETAVQAAGSGIAEEIARATAGGAAADASDVESLIAQMQAEHAATVPKPVLHRPHIDGPSGRIIAVGRPDDDGNDAKTWGEVLLSVSVPGRARYGARWTGYIPAAKAKLQWLDLPLDVDGDHPGEVQIRWDDAAGIELITPLLGEWNEQLQAQLDAPIGASTDSFGRLLAMIPDPERRAEAERQLAAGLGRTASASPDSLADPLDELERLGELRSSGAVSEEEFAARKAQLLRET